MQIPVRRPDKRMPPQRNRQDKRCRNDTAKRQCAQPYAVLGRGHARKLYINIFHKPALFAELGFNENGVEKILGLDIPKTRDKLSFALLAGARDLYGCRYKF